MNQSILAVDDEPLILRSYKRNLGDLFDITIAEGAEAALSLIGEQPFAVILSDIKMPVMDGITLLHRAKELQPDAVRMIISGHADMGDAINSVNQAGIFRLMLKPCPIVDLSQNLTDGLEQHRLITAEKALLEDTLKGAIQSLMDILGILDGDAFGQAQLRRRMAHELAIQMRAPVWEFEMAALLSEIGRATLPPSLNEKIKNGQKLTESETKLVERIPEFSSRLLNKIPRIEGVVDALLYQNKHFNGVGFPPDSRAGADLPLAARALHAINGLMAMHRRGMSPDEAISMLKMGPEKYDPTVVTALYSCVALLKGKPKQTDHPAGPHQAKLAELAPGMLLLADITTREGVVVLGSGTRLTEVHIQRIRNFAQLNTVNEPLLVE